MINGGQRASRRTTIIITVVAVVVVGTFIAIAVVDRGQRTARTAPEDVQSFENLSSNHVEGTVSYPQTPPVGGEHNQVWQNCGPYNEPVRNETAVHSLEHGAVWITYHPGLPQEQVDAIREQASGQTYVLVSPFPGLPAPVVASAWGRQLWLKGTDDSRLEQFVGAFRQGSQAPEPNAPCTGGTGSPR